MLENNNLKLRRSKSVDAAGDIIKHEEILRKSQPDKPFHKYQDSLFSWSSGFDKFTGFVNWAFLLLGIGGIRLLLENFLKYGIRINPWDWVAFLFGADGGESYISIFVLSYSLVPVLLSLFIEKSLSKQIVGEILATVLQAINMLLIVVLPVVVITVYYDGIALSGATLISFIYCIIFLKLWSYVQVNRWCRFDFHNKKKQRIKQIHSVNNLYKSKSLKSEESAENLDFICYPDNLNVKDITYFMFIPTFCYELNFPRTDRIRKRFLMKRFLELVIGGHLLGCLFQQWMIPSVKFALIPFTNMDVMNATERLLKLSVPNHLMWLIMFYLMFHSYLNLMGEIFHFADRNFYSDWWNANNIEEFWRKWNTPVHKWALRHVYLPLIDAGYHRRTASIVVFFISAFFHEFLVSVPLRTFKSWAFIGMMMQIPLAQLSSCIEEMYGPRWGNVTVWLSLILGQPLCIMMYYHDYIVTHYGKALINEFGDV